MSAPLKVATRLAVAAAGGPLAVGALLGVSETTAWRWGAPDHPEFVPLKTVPVIEAAGPSTHITGALATMAGCALVPLVGEASAPDLARAVGAIGRQSGAVFAAAADALADGRLTKAERARLVAQVRQLVQVGERAAQVLAEGAG